MGKELEAMGIKRKEDVMPSGIDYIYSRESRT